MAYEKLMKEGIELIALARAVKKNKKSIVFLELMEMDYKGLKEISRVFPKMSSLIDNIIELRFK